MLLGIDVGASAIKCVAFAADDAMLARVAAPYEIAAPASAWSEVDAEDLWRRVAALIGRCIEAVPVARRTTPRSVGIAALLGFLLVDEHGRPVTRAVLWSDRRAHAEAEVMRARLSADPLHRLAGKPAAPERAAALYLWWRRHEPEAAARARTLLALKDYLVLRLTGEVATDWIHASYTITMLFDLGRRQWEPGVAEALGIDPCRCRARCSAFARA